MGYFKDVLGILLLKDEAYKKVGNDRYAFKKFILAHFISTYAISLFFGTLIMIGIQFLGDIQVGVLVPLLILLVLPLPLLLAYYVCTFISHIIGLAVGGRPHNFRDFFKVYNYVNPVLNPLLFLGGNVLGPILGIWGFCILYKTYRNIHRLSPWKAGTAIAAHIILLLAFILVIFASFFYLVTSTA